MTASAWRRGRRRDGLRVELGRVIGALVAGVLLPWGLFYGYDAAVLEPLSNVLIGETAAIVVGHYFLERLIAFPGTRATSYILPTFVTTWGLMLTTFFVLRLEYARAQFLAGFAACALWYYATHFIRSRARPRRLGVVPVGRGVSLLERTSVGLVLTRLEGPDVSTAGLDGVVADFRGDLDDAWERFIAEEAISGLPVFNVKQLEESVSGVVDIEHLSENNFGALIPALAYIKIKQIVDIVAAIVVGAVLLAPMLMVGAAIRLDSPGPSLFRQRRMGYRGRVFTVLKFRTMRVADPAATGDPRLRAMTLADDDRVTRLGRLLRRSRIDELPQLVNVLRGEMSWIGPRPEVIDLSRWYEAEIPFYRYRHIVRPGITGWAQVRQGHVAEVADVIGKLRYDFYYIKYFSPWLDMLIVLRTLKIIFTGFGAR